jgi:poly-beta-1,6-N-acetyl-D-glucosamine biosynthesis protein PgaD
VIELKPNEWPPLIHGAEVPVWVRVRDVVLTLLAWVVLAWVLREGLELTIDYFSPPRFEFTNFSPPNLLELVSRLAGFLYFIAALFAWLIFWAVVRGPRLRLSAPAVQPPGLTLPDHAADFELAADAIAPWRDARVLVVHFDSQGRLSHGEVRPPG